MTYEERLEAAERHRLTGNGLFQEVCTYLSGTSCLLLPGLGLWLCKPVPVHHLLPADRGLCDCMVRSVIAGQLSGK